MVVPRITDTVSTPMADIAFLQSLLAEAENPSLPEALDFGLTLEDFLAENTLPKIKERAAEHETHAAHWERQIKEHPAGSHKRYQALAQAVFHHKEAWKHHEMAKDLERDPAERAKHEAGAKAAYAHMKGLHPHLKAAHAAQPTRWVG